MVKERREYREPVTRSRDALTVEEFPSLVKIAQLTTWGSRTYTIAKTMIHHRLSDFTYKDNFSHLPVRGSPERRSTENDSQIFLRSRVPGLTVGLTTI